MQSSQSNSGSFSCLDKNAENLTNLAHKPLNFLKLSFWLVFMALEHTAQILKTVEVTIFGPIFNDPCAN